ncbi:glycosyl transferase family 28 [Glaciihabitans tibetensis]|uniref:Glycosyl transferase family 28 n=1 Tax=Glaciihabitans tibetensis TaxID=1266600 RepID=A0A2T0VBY3_9MICO|nr:glycosyltransferase [Glaciihabitans tibetensis]PRY67680.1 glycosyl transferase family 28 [Glaciihabitans tibetensis]
MTRIGWYVHHHGRGHLGRLLAIAPHVAGEIVCFSSLPQPATLPANCRWVLLDRDDAEEPETGGPVRHRNTDAGGLLHWAPLLHNGHRRRLTAIATQLDHSPVSAFVVDVSAEVTLFVRLLGIPTVLITQPGTRDDIPHDLAFRAATSVIAPWPGDLMRPAHLNALPRVAYVGGISRFAGRQDATPSLDDAAASLPAAAPSLPAAASDLPAAASDRPARSGNARPEVLVLGGAGGSDVTAESITAAAAATPGYTWSALGIPGFGGGWSEDPWVQLRRADIVVAWAGQSSIADLAAANARAVIIPQERPFEEQAQTAQALAQAGLAVVETCWPAADAWPGLLEKARSLRPEWSRWQTAGAAERAAAEIEATVIEATAGAVRS